MLPSTPTTTSINGNIGCTRHKSNKFDILLSLARYFRSQFNSDWAGKLLIVVDEVLLNRREDTERLKNLSTALTYKVEAKGKDRYEVPFYTKFVLCSNNERNPVLIDAEETRFWVRKVNRLETDDTQFLYKLKAEIPAFLFWLSNRQLTTEQECRMWFRPSLIHTPALDKIIRNNCSRVEIDMCEQILEVMNEQNIGEFCFCINDLLALLENTRHKVERCQVRVVVQDFWKLTPAPNAYTYVTYETDYLTQLTYKAVKWTGRYYKVSRAFLEPSVDLLKCWI